MYENFESIPLKLTKKEILEKSTHHTHQIVKLNISLQFFRLIEKEFYCGKNLDALLYQLLNGIFQYWLRNDHITVILAIFFQ